ncbi:E3 SUMO-protein ligase KIAA1586-like isoform X1 [Melanaphis sacchari]|uniref:E3 SUMO-protein ligase KIAA1586-like isoform X1 n=2 Tax=Melanaphis sacchari TaxID=742174 RepID=UPI000DC14027|nr:E3 SUMO-protein ligase KIAA1586-like isoform X1 [Melanaphis sacchari]
MNKKLAPKSSSGLMKKWLYKSKNTDLNIDNLVDNLINTTSGNSTTVNSLDNTINTEISEIQQNNTTLVNDSSCIKHFHFKGKHLIRCEPCYAEQDIVKRYSNNKSKVPAIAQEYGTKYLLKVLNDHLSTTYHIEAIKVHKYKTLNTSEKMAITPMGKAVNQANDKLARKIGCLMIHVYNDAKKLTLSAYSFPSRVIVSQKANLFQLNGEVSNNIDDSELQYLTPHTHKDLLECIVETHQSSFVEDILNNSLALSLRCDGSVDRTQIDKMYVLMKSITLEGEEKLYFLGAEEPVERGAKGMCDALKTACVKRLGNENFNNILKKTSSLVTDGASSNVGQKSGLWTLLTNLKKTACGTEVMSPLITLWCAAHRSNLAWESVSESVPEVSLLFQKLVGLTTFFRRSGLRTRELKNIALEYNLKLLQLPKVFEVRWSQFSYTLLNNVLVSWSCLVNYFKNSSDKVHVGHFKFLTHEYNIRLMAVLADVLYIFSRYQQQLQSDDLNVISMDEKTMYIINKIEMLKSTPLIGGWVEALDKQVVINKDGSLTLNSITIKSIEIPRHKSHHKFVTQNRCLAAVKQEIVCSLQEFLKQRFSIDKNLLSIIKPFVVLSSVACIKDIHNLIGADIDLKEFSLEYDELISMENISELRKINLIKLVKTLCGSKYFPNVCTMLARVAAAKPHSADVERLISASNLLKSPLRSTMNIETENLSLYINYNMPPLYGWDPRDTVYHWMSKKKHRVLKRRKGKEQSYFSGVFFEASGKNKIINSDDSGEDTEDKKKKKF